MISPDQNPHQTVTFSGCIWSWCISRGLVSSQIRQFCLFTYPFIQKWASSLKMICLAKFGLTSNCSRTQSANTWRCLWSFTLSPSVEFYRGADPSSDAKFAKLKSQKGQVLVNDEKLTAGFSRTLSRTAVMFSADLAFRRHIG